MTLQAAGQTLCRRLTLGWRQMLLARHGRVFQPMAMGGVTAADPGDLSDRFWQCAAELGALGEQERLEAIENGWSSRWLSAMRQHLHLKTSELEPLLALSEATLLRRVRQEAPLDLVPSERLDRLIEVISLAYTVFEDPANTEAWLKAPHPLLQQVSPLQHCRTAIGASQVKRLLLAIEQGAPV